MDSTIYLVQAFARNRDRLVPATRRSRSLGGAVKVAKSLAKHMAGAAAVRLTRDAETGQPIEATVVGRWGDVPDDICASLVEDRPADRFYVLGYPSGGGRTIRRLTALSAEDALLTLRSLGADIAGAAALRVSTRGAVRSVTVLQMVGEVPGDPTERLTTELDANRAAPSGPYRPGSPF